MKTLIKLSLIFILVLGVNINFSHADEACAPPMNCAGNLSVDEFADEFGGGGANTPAATGDRTIKITVTEKIPGVECTALVREYVSESPTFVPSGDSDAPAARYECLVPIGWTAFLAVLGRMIRFLTGIALLGAVLFLVFNGIRLSMAGVDGEAKGKVKTQILGTLAGIILLLLSGPLLKLIAPWVYT